MYSRGRRQVAKDGAVKEQFFAKARAGHLGQHGSSIKTLKSARRLLILHGHGSHHARQFIEYCDKHNIVPFGMCLNLGHALQLTSRCCFQLLKHSYGKALHVGVRDSLGHITKLEFLSCI